MFYSFQATVCKIAKPARMVWKRLVDWSGKAENDQMVSGFYQSVLNFQFTCPGDRSRGWTVCVCMQTYSSRVIFVFESEGGGIYRGSTGDPACSQTWPKDTTGLKPGGGGGAIQRANFHVPL